MVNVRKTNISPEVSGTETATGEVFDDTQWLNYRTTWSQNPQKGIVDEGPLQIDLFAVDVCNLRCPMCPRVSFIPGTGYMDLAAIKNILDQAGEYNVSAFNFAGLGEPTLHPDLFEILRYAKSKGIVDVNMHTNGTRLGPGFNRELLESGLDRIIISLDSADKKAYEKIRVGANFEKVYAGVEDLISQRNELGRRKPHVKVNFINMDEDDTQAKDAFIAHWRDKANRIAVLRYLDCQGEDETLAFDENYIQDGDFCCPELWRRMMILSDGTVTLCPRDVQKRYVVSSVFEKNLREIWQGERMQYVRKQHREGRFKDVAMCENCPDSFYEREDAGKAHEGLCHT